MRIRATKPRIMMPKRPLNTRLGTQTLPEQLLELVGQGTNVERGGLGVVVLFGVQDQVGQSIKWWSSVAQFDVEHG